MKNIFIGFMILSVFVFTAIPPLEAKGIARTNRAQADVTADNGMTHLGKKHPNARQNRGEASLNNKRLEGKEKAIQRRLEGKEKAIQRRLEGKEKILQGRTNEDKTLRHRKHKKNNVNENAVTDRTRHLKNKRAIKQNN